MVQDCSSLHFLAKYVAWEEVQVMAQGFTFLHILALQVVRRKVPRGARTTNPCR